MHMSRLYPTQPGNRMHHIDYITASFFLVVTIYPLLRSSYQSFSPSDLRRFNPTHNSSL